MGRHRSLPFPAVLVAAACTTVVGLPDLPVVDHDSGSALADAGGAAASGPDDPTAGAGDGGGGRGGASSQSGGGGTKGGSAQNGGKSGAQGGMSGVSHGGSDTGASSGTGAADNGGSSNGGSSNGGSDMNGGTGNTGGGGSSGAGTGGTAGTGGSPPLTDCGGTSVDLTTTSAHCGACGYACVNGRECVGGRCTPAWQPIATAGAPAARSSHAAAFVAGKFIVLGGSIEWDGPALDTTGAYDPVTDSWSAVAPMKTARCLHRAVSTGSEIYTFGGVTSCADFNTLGPGLERFVPNSGLGSWTTVSATGAPSPRYNLNMAWTGSAVVVYGGNDGSLPSVATGGRFDTSSSHWVDASCSLPECDRTQGAFFKDGDLVHFMGGEFNPDYPEWKGNAMTATSGLTYDPAANSWSTWPRPDRTSVGNGPSADDGRRLYFPSGNYVAIYDRMTGWLENDRSQMPAGLCGSGAAYAWSGTEMIGWSGNCSPAATDVGGRYQPAAPP